MCVFNDFRNNIFHFLRISSITETFAKNIFHDKFCSLVYRNPPSYAADLFATMTLIL